MKRFFAFELKIVSVLVAVVILVAATGYFAYRSMTGIVQEVSMAARPDAKLTLLKQILSDLSDAESSVKSYNLTQNNEYLTPFYSSLSSVDERMEELKQLSKKNGAQKIIAERIHKLVEKKYELLNELLVLHYDDRITDELKKISVNLEQRRSVAPPEKKTSTIFTKIFGTKGTTPQRIDPEKETVRLKDIQQELSKVTKEQEKQFAENRKKELALTRKGKEVMDNIRSLILRAEKAELALLAQKTQQAERKAAEANTLIAFFCLAIMLLVCIVSLVIVSYVRKNRRYGKALAHAKMEAENLAKARENFLANMSHEIRTPMNAIAGFTEQVLQSKLESAQKEQLEIVKRSADHLLKIINDILDFAKIRSGKLSLERSGFLPGQEVNDTMRLLEQQAKNKNILLTHQLGPEIPDILIGDAVRFRQILLNLVSNAVKFTEQGGVDVRISCLQRDGNKAVMLMEIQDTGIGIPAEKLSHIFEEFEQANNSISKKYGGTGLGLTITKELVEMQGGSITISSRASQGTTVVVSIPYAIGSPADLPAKEPEIIVNGLLKGKNILVADDEAYNRMLIAALMKKWGVHITESRTGEEVLLELNNHRYDMVLMDIRMPGMDGIETCSRIRKMKNREKAKTPVIALTAVTAAEDRERCRQAGMNDFLAKPFQEKDLYQKITTVLSGEKQGVSPDFSYLQSNEPEVKKYSLDGLRSIVKGDDEFYKEMIRVFIRSTRDGFERMNQALAEQNWEVIADIAHKIISPCIHFEAKRLVELLKKIEKNIRDHKDTASVAGLLKEASLEAEAIVQDLEKDHL